MTILEIETMKARNIVTALAVVGVFAAVGSDARAQNAGAEQAQRTGAPPMEVPPVNGAPEERGTRAPVLRIVSVEVMRTAHAPVMDIIRVRGLASSSGWEEAELVPLSHGVPADGMLQLVFVARAPTEATEAGGFEPIEAIFPLETNHPFKGVNVHSHTDSVSVTSLPGYSEGKAIEDCGKCVGKTFVAKGASAPAGRPASELVREEQLPGGVRVIRPGDGIGSSDSNPNRLTLILNKDGRIATAVWE
jgi:hypothetical protein